MRLLCLALVATAIGCPAGWTAALAKAADCDDDAGVMPCWKANTECGIDVLSATQGPNPMLFYYDHETGTLIGAAIQTSDVVESPEECIPSELIAGDKPPSCCDDEDDDGGT